MDSIPTTPTNHLPDWLGLNKNARGQKREDNLDDPVRAVISAARMITGSEDKCGNFDAGIWRRSILHGQEGDFVPLLAEVLIQFR
jgi:hypothetical protein